MLNLSPNQMHKSKDTVPSASEKERYYQAAPSWSMPPVEDPQQTRNIMLLILLCTWHSSTLCHDKLLSAMEHPPVKGPSWAANPSVCDYATEAAMNLPAALVQVNALGLLQQ